MLWLCLYFPALPLEALTRLDQKAQQQAILIAEQFRVLYANSYATQQGVSIGQSVATAKAICQQLHIMERDTAQERKALQRLALHSYQFTPMVSLQPPAAIVLEISSSLKLFNGLSSLKKQIIKVITDLGHQCQIGSSLTPEAAWLAASSNLPGISSDNPSPPHQQLHTLPLKHLSISDKQLRQLQDMGFNKLGELLALPPHTLGKRFGHEFLHYVQRITGKRHDPRTAILLPKQFNSELFYIDGMETTQALLFPIKRLLSEFCQYLRQRQLHCQGFNWLLTQSKQQQELVIHLSKAQNHHASFLELTRIKLESLKLRGSVYTITLSSARFSPATAATQDLLDYKDCGQQTNNPPENLLDRLHARLGADSLFGITSSEEHAPERAWQAISDRQLRENSGIQRAKHKPDLSVCKGSRPSWLLDRPAPIQQRQQQLYWQGKKLTLLKGPERIDSDWWRENHTQRDYFVARHQQGQLYWIYRDIPSKRWFLHGLFA